MNTINKNWLWVIGGLLLLNITLLGFIWVKKPNHEPPPFLEEKLNLTEDQKEQFERLKAEHMDGMKELESDINRLRDKLYEDFSDEKLSDSEVKKISQELGELRAKGDFLTYQHFQDVLAICNSDQQEKFGELVTEIVRGMNGPRAPREGNRGGRPDGPMQGGPPDGRMGPPPSGGPLPPPR